MKYLLFVLVLAACGDEPKYTVEQLQNPETCKECHPKHYDQWAGSMHAYASDDPVFLAMNKRGQRDTNGALGDLCIKCHAPMALELGLAKGADFDPATLPPEAKGVTCFFCHNVEQVTDDHNNPLKLAMDQTMRGGARKPVDNPAHHSKYDEMMAGKTSNSTMCGACHDIVMPNGVHLERTFSEWKETIFAQNDPAAFLPQTCTSCHMFPSDEIIADNPDLPVKSRDNGFHEHMWPAIDQALTPFPQMAEQEAAIMRDLTPAIAIKGIKPINTPEAPGGICLDPPGVLSVRIDSFSVGHMFPSGASHDRRMWLHVEVFDASGSTIYEKGEVQPGMDPEDMGEPALTTDCEMDLPSCSAFYDRTFKEDGTPAHFFWEVATVKSRLIKPPVTRDPNQVGYDHSTTVKFDVGSAILQQADRIEAQLYMRPLPFAVLRDLEQSGDLDPSIKDKVKTLPVGEKSVWTKATKGTGPALNTNCNPF